VAEQADVTDIWINRPCEVWIETLGGTIERFDEPGLDEAILGRLACQIGIHPLKAAPVFVSGPRNR
jgi:type IV secretion system protein VirB11